MSNDIFDDLDFIFHHGILGMRWGLRRYQNKDGSLTSAGRARKRALRKEKKEAREKAKKIAQEKKSGNNIKSMSDEELKSKVNRMNLEKQYKQALQDMNPQKKSEVKKLIGDVLKSSAKTVGIQTATYIMRQGANKALSKAFNDEDPLDLKKKKKENNN